MGQTPTKDEGASNRSNEAVSSPETFDLSNRDLSVTGMQDLKDLGEKYSLLKSLTLQNCQLSHLENIVYFQNLQNLDLSRNLLVSLDDEKNEVLFFLKELLQLNLSYNYLSNVPPLIFNLNKLKILNLSNNNIALICEEIQYLDHLIDMDLSFNQLAFLPDGLEKLTNLAKLKLNSNEIKQLPSLPSSLVFLNLNDNLLKSLPTSIGKLSMLKKLYLDNNELLEVPSELGQLAQLRELNLNNNQLIDLPKSIGMLKELTILDISDNLFEAKEFFDPEVSSLLNFIRTKNFNPKRNEKYKSKRRRGDTLRVLPSMRQNQPKRRMIASWNNDENGNENEKNNEKNNNTNNNTNNNNNSSLTSNDAVLQKLYRFKNIEDIQIGDSTSVVLVDRVICSFHSLNMGDVFLFDCGDVMWIWVGQQSHPNELLKAKYMTEKINQDFGSSIPVQILDSKNMAVWETSQMFWKKLGMATESECKTWIKAAKAAKPVSRPNSRRFSSGSPLKTELFPPTIDKEALEFRIQETKIYKFAEQDADDRTQIQVVSKGEPPVKSILDSSSCFLIDIPFNPSVFIWAGTYATPESKSWALLKAEEIINRDASMYNRIMAWNIDDAESWDFKELFFDWLDVEWDPVQKERIRVAMQLHEELLKQIEEEGKLALQNVQQDQETASNETDDDDAQDDADDDDAGMIIENNRIEHDRESERLAEQNRLEAAQKLEQERREKEIEEKERELIEKRKKQAAEAAAAAALEAKREAERRRQLAREEEEAAERRRKAEREKAIKEEQERIRLQKEAEAKRAQKEAEAAAAAAAAEAAKQAAVKKAEQESKKPKSPKTTKEDSKDSSKKDSSKKEAAKQEAVKQEAIKQETIKQEAAKQEAIKQEPPKPSLQDLSKLFVLPPSSRPTPSHVIKSVQSAIQCDKNQSQTIEKLYKPPSLDKTKVERPSTTIQIDPNAPSVLGDIPDAQRSNGLLAGPKRAIGPSGRRAATANAAKTRADLETKETAPTTKLAIGGAFGLLRAVGADAALLQRKPKAETTSQSSSEASLYQKGQPRLIQLKGRRKILIRQVEVSVSSLNSGDVFILDNGKGIIYQWNGKDANRMEKGKAMDLAKNIKDKEYSGTARVNVLEEGKTDTNINDPFWKALHGIIPNQDNPSAKPMPTSYDQLNIKSASEGGDDDEAEQLLKSYCDLYKLSPGKKDRLEPELIASYPVKKELLEPEECYILDCVCEIFVWCGKNSAIKARKQSLDVAIKLVTARTDLWVAPIVRELPGGESVLFREKFSNWGYGPPIQMQKIAVGKNVAKKGEEEKIDVEALYNNKVQRQEVMVDASGNGEVHVWRIVDFKKVPVDKSTYGQFYAGDTYIILYKYHVGNREAFLVYYWQGRTSTINEKGTSALLTIELDKEFKANGTAKEVRVVQNQEPKHFLMIFKDKYIVHLGKYVDHFIQTNKSPEAALYEIGGASMKEYARTIEVDAVKPAFKSSTSFILVSRDRKTTYVWNGRFSSSVSIELANKSALIIAQQFKSSSSITTVSEGKEPSGFWDKQNGLGYPNNAYPKIESTATSGLACESRLFHASEASGQFRVSEIPYPFSKDDLSRNDCYILDAWDRVYVWQQRASASETKRSLETATEYFELALKDRKDVVRSSKSKDPVVSKDTILRVESGKEPLIFTSRFMAWTPNPAQNLNQHLESGSEFLSRFTQKYSYDDLINKNYPAGIDTTRLEDYLEDEEFEQILEMERTAFAALPGWQQQKIKRAKSLF